MAEIFRPVGGIADLDRLTQNAAHIRRQTAKLGHGGKAVASGADRRQPDHLGPDQEGIDPARGRAKMRVMQDEPTIGPLGRASIGDAVPIALEIPRPCGAEKARDLGGGRSGSRGAAIATGGDAGGDAPAPRHDRLACRAAPRVGAGVARQLLHQDERIEHRLAPAVADRAQRLHDRAIGRRAAIDRPVIDTRDLLHLIAPDAACAPRHFTAIARRVLDFGLHRAFADAQIVAKPRHHQRNRTDLRQLLSQNLHRGLKIGACDRRVAIDDLRLAQAQIIADRLGRQRIFAGTGDHRDRLHLARQAPAALRGPRHLERQLRDAVAPFFQPQILDHDIGDTAIGRGLVPHLRRDRGVGQLRLIPVIDAHVQLVRRDLLAIRPDAADAKDRPLAQRQRKAQPIADIRHAGGRALAAALLLANLDQRCGPDAMAGHAHLSPQTRHRIAFARGLDAHAVHAPGLDRL